jgi:hypothetical protein
MSARLYFDLVNTHQSIQDREGIEVDDVDQAKVAVAEMLEEHRQEDAATAQDWSGWMLRVSDGAGHVLFSVDLDSHGQPHRHPLARRANGLTQRKEYSTATRVGRGSR